MKNKILIFSICIVLFMIGSCTKFGKNITVEGTVLNPITKKTYKGIEVLLVKSQNLQYYGGYKEIKHTFTDANGHFELSAGRIGPIWVQIGSKPENSPDYYLLGWDYNGKYYSQLKADKGEVMHVDYHMVPYGESKANVNNVNCQGTTDTAYFKLKYILSPDLYDYWSPPRVGCYSHSDVSPAKRPMGEYVWITKIKHTGETAYQYKYDTVFISQNGVSTFNINY